jgi:hypothetical protein
VSESTSLCSATWWFVFRSTVAVEGESVSLGCKCFAVFDMCFEVASYLGFLFEMLYRECFLFKRDLMLKSQSLVHEQVCQTCQSTALYSSPGYSATWSSLATHFAQS